MFVYIPDREGSSPQVCWADDLATLSVCVESSPADFETLSQAVRASAIGELVGEHVWLDITWLRDAASDRSHHWHVRFDGMLAYARARGWLTADERRIRAHVEWGESKTNASRRLQTKTERV